MKRAVTCFLIVFIVVAVTTKIVLLNIPQEVPTMVDGNHIVLCHAEARCPTCLKMELLIKRALQEQEHGNVDLVTIEYDMPKNREFVERFHVGTLAIILLEWKNGETVRSCDVSADARSLIGNSNDFVEMLEAKLNEFYGQTRRQ